MCELTTKTWIINVYVNLISAFWNQPSFGLWINAKNREFEQCPDYGLMVARERFELLFLSLRQTRILSASNATVDVWEGKRGYVPKLLSKQKIAENLNQDLNLFPGAKMCPH